MFFLKKNHYIALLLLAAFGAGLAFFTFVAFNQFEQEKIRVNLKEKGKDRISTFQELIDKNIEEIFSLAAFFNASEEVERLEFRAFTQAILTHHPGLQALEWILRVPDPERLQHEESARRNGLPGYRVTERKEQGNMVPAGKRTEYFPIYYLEPNAGNEEALGYDLGSNPVRLATLNLARDMASPVATPRVTLVQEPGEHFAILVFLPVYKKNMEVKTVAGRRAALYGLVIGVLRVDKMLEQALSVLSHQEIDIYLFDAKEENPARRFMGYHAAGGGSLFSGLYPDEETVAAGYSYSLDVRVAGRSWKAYCKPTEEFLQQSMSWHVWGVPGFILLFTGSVYLYLLFYFHHTESVKRQAEKIARAKSELEAEIRERKRAEDEREKLEIELRHAHKMEAIGTLAGGIAHDFNNILTIIIGNTDLARLLLAQDSPAAVKLQEVLAASNRAKNLVSQILSFSRKAEKGLQPVRPYGFVRETVNMLRSTIPAMVEIAEDMDEQCGTILVDPTQVDQLLINLCTNAVHAMNEKGILTIGLHHKFLDAAALAHRPDMKPGTYVEISVGDTGCGIDPAIIERVFDPFFTTKELGEGTGMGLAMVHGIVTSHRGMITVESAPGQGTVFRACFPVKEGADAVPEQVLDSLPTGTERILLVDDEEGIADLVAKILEQQGFRVVTRTKSTGALELFRKEPDRIDLVITDQAMPEMSGTEFTGAIKKIRPDIPVILCTGYSRTVSSGDEAEKLGLAAFLLKPVDREELIRTVRRVLDEGNSGTPLQPAGG
jgi:signal transduction histidine kinase/ActR/RegA family two-component response regulator